MQAYCVPEFSLVGPRNIFQAAMWRSTNNRWWSTAGPDGSGAATNAQAVLEILAWGLLVHAVLHLVKDVMLFDLLKVPKAVR